MTIVFNINFLLNANLFSRVFVKRSGHLSTKFCVFNFFVCGKR